MYNCDEIDFEWIFSIVFGGYSIPSDCKLYSPCSCYFKIYPVSFKRTQLLLWRSVSMTYFFIVLLFYSIFFIVNVEWTWGDENIHAEEAAG